MPGRLPVHSARIPDGYPWPQAQCIILLCDSSRMSLAHDPGIRAVRNSWTSVFSASLHRGYLRLDQTIVRRQPDGRPLPLIPHRSRQFRRVHFP